MGNTNSLESAYNDETFCTNSSVLPHQIKASDRMSDLPEGQRGLLLFHEIGSGKTLTSLLSIQKIMKKDKTIKHIYLIMNGILVKNFKIEMEKHGFTDMKTIHVTSADQDFKDGVIIMDEIHLFIFNLINMKNDFEVNLYKKLEEAVNCKIIMMTGTPIYDSPFDMSPMINLLAGSEVFPRIGMDFKNLYLNEFKIAPFRIGILRKIFKQYISYFGMENSILYPKVKSIEMLYFDVPYESRREVSVAKDEYFISNGVFDAIANNIKTHVSEIGNIFIYCAYPEKMNLIEQFMNDNNLTPYIKISEANLTEAHKYKYIIGSSESTVGISIPDCRFAYLLSVPDYFGDIQQVSGRIRRICIHREIPQKLRDIKYWVLVSSHSGSLIKTKLREIGLYNKINTQFIEIMKDARI